MHARKIALHRTSIIALIMTLLVIGSALAIAGNSTAISPQVGKVSYKASYYLGGSSIGPAISSTVVSVDTPNGVHVTDLTGPTGSISLAYGTYVFSVAPSVVQSGGTSLVSNGTTHVVNVTSSTTTVSLKLTAYSTNPNTVKINGISSGTASVTFSTPSGFVFATNVVNSTTATNGFTVNLPTGDFYATVVYGGETFNNYVASVPSGGLKLSLTGSVFGYVNSASTGNPLQNFNLVDLNLTSKTYTVQAFTGGVFHVNSTSTPNNVYVLTAKGYQPRDIQGTTNGLTYALNKSSSNVTYTYSLGTNPGYLNLSVNYTITNSTALPFMPDSSIGSFYWQNQFDGFSTSVSSIEQNLTSLVGRYTNNSITVAGFNYNETGFAKIAYKTTIGATSNGMTYNVTYTFKNVNITESDVTSGFAVKLFAHGTQYTFGALYYNYVFRYDIAGVSLASPSTTASTFVSPVHILPQASSGWLNLQFSSVQAPVIVASEMSLYWNNTTPQNYLVSSNSTSAVYLVPTHVPVYFNVSSAYFNPVTGTNDYSKSLNYSWYVNGTPAFTGPASVLQYNKSLTFTGHGPFNVTVNVTSASNAYNQTSFTIYAFNGTPQASLNVTSLGNALFKTATVSGSVNLTVPQSKTVQFSAYGSYYTIPGTTYKAPLSYKWYFPGFTNTAVNVSQTFNTPWIQSGKLVNGYLNVATSAGIFGNVTLKINVTDTTPPVPQITLTNSTGGTIPQPVAGQVANFSANSTTVKYYTPTELNYTWSVVYSNGTQVQNGSSTYELITNNTHLMYFKVKFNTLNSYVVSLKVTTPQPSNVSAYANFTTNVVVNSPLLKVLSVYFPTTPAQGSNTPVYVNVSNNGTVNANSFSVIVKLSDGSVVGQASFGALAIGVTKQVEVNISVPTSGSVSFIFQATNSSQPSFFASEFGLSISHSVNPPAYRTPLIVGIVIAVIVLIGVAYYRLSSRRPSSKPAERKQTAKKPEEKKK